MRHNASTIKAYLEGLPAERRAALESIRAVIKRNIDKKFEEGMQYGMPGWYVPHSVYPAGYHCNPKEPVPFVSIASQKNHMAIYMFCVYCVPGEAEWFSKAWKATGKKLDMGKGCVRFTKIDDVALDVVGQVIKRATMKRFLEHYESITSGSGRRRPGSKKTTKKAGSAKTAKAAGPKTKTKTTKKKSGKSAVSKNR